MMLKIEFKKNKSADGLMKDIKDFHIHVRTLYNLPIKKSYAGYNVFHGIAIPSLFLLL